MSATSQTLDHAPPVEGDSDDTRETGARTRGVAPRYSGASSLYDVVATSRHATGTVARLVLGLVLFPHAAQKVLGWFGGAGLAGTYDYFTTTLALPGFIAGAVIALELVGSLMLIVGAFTRIAAGAILPILLGAILMSHLGNGFFMNWSSTQMGEGIEYHLLALGLAVVSIIAGGGALSIDRYLTKRLRPRVDPVAGHFMGGDDEVPRAIPIPAL